MIFFLGNLNKKLDLIGGGVNEVVTPNDYESNRPANDRTNSSI